MASPVPIASLKPLSSRLPPLMTAEEAHARLGGGSSERILPLGVPALDAALPQQGLALGRVIELQVQGPSGAATSFASCACRAAQRANFSEELPHAGGLQGVARFIRQEKRERNWCAFIDPCGTLFAPGLARLGIDLSRLLVVRPNVESVGQAAVRIVESNIAALVVIDLRGALSSSSSDEHSWQRTTRRLSLALESTATCVLLITQAERRQSLPLPTFLRLQLTRSSRDLFQIRVIKDRMGRSYPPQTIPFSIFGSIPDPSTGFGTKTNADRFSAGSEEEAQNAARRWREVS